MRCTLGTIAVFLVGWPGAAFSGEPAAPGAESPSPALCCPADSSAQDFCKWREHPSRFSIFDEISPSAIEEIKPQVQLGCDEYVRGVTTGASPDGIIVFLGGICAEGGRVLIFHKTDEGWVLARVSSWTLRRGADPCAY